jgi:hypothetical protein
MGTSEPSDPGREEKEDDASRTPQSPGSKPSGSERHKVSNESKESIKVIVFGVWLMVQELMWVQRVWVVRRKVGEGREERRKGRKCERKEGGIELMRYLEMKWARVYIGQAGCLAPSQCKADALRHCCRPAIVHDIIHTAIPVNSKAFVALMVGLYLAV